MRELSARVGVTPRTITSYESMGASEPSAPVLEELASVLRFPIAFFFRPDAEPVHGMSATFRSLSRMTAAKRDSALAGGSLALDLRSLIDAHLELPQPQVADRRDLGPSEAATIVRAEWGLGDKHCGNLVHLLERFGVRVFSIDAAHEVDAFSLWISEQPFVFVNTKKSAERGRFDCAHELGHLLLDRHAPAPNKDRERLADEFAANFLMPESSVRARVGTRFVDVARVHALKAEWGVSAFALARRLYDLSMLTEWRYKSICREIAMTTGRDNELNGERSETSRLLPKVFTQLANMGLTRERIAARLCLFADEINSLTFGYFALRMS